MSIDIGALKFGEFELKSGRVSPYFFNMGLFSSGQSMKNIGDFYGDALEFKESYNLDSKNISSLSNNIEFFSDLSKALKGTKFVIEAINENLEEKIKIRDSFCSTSFQDLVMHMMSLFYRRSYVKQIALGTRLGFC